MLRILFLTSLLFLTQFCRKPATLRFSGSESMHDMVEALAEGYSESQSAVNVIVRGGGSETGIRDLNDGKVHAALVSRELSPDESRVLGEPEKIILGFDGLAFAVHLANNLDELSLEDVKAIFTGKITNWKALGGEDRPVTLVVRDADSGTTRLFLTEILGKDIPAYQMIDTKRDFPTGAITAKDYDAVSGKIAGNKGAIGFIAMGAANVDNAGRIKVLKLAARKGEPGVLPTPANVNARKYPIARELYFIYRKGGPEILEAFVSYALSKDGQQAILKAGYLGAVLPEVVVTP